VASNGGQLHHGSHRDLLWTGDHIEPASIDAVIVPTIRRPGYLLEAAQLAEALGCVLVTLHSKQWTSAERAMQRLPRSVELIAIDVADVGQLNRPHWQTGQYLPDKIFPRLAKYPRTDLTAKRNLGLVLSRLLGWSSVMFLDDDITELNPDDVRRASGFLDTHNAAGLHVCGFHDHSVVCHAYRDAGGRQQSFIGGGALLVEVRRNRSFFPEIYNDDWFFLLDGEKGLQSTAVTGRVVQYPYDPFRPDRARAEEFGDVLAEGIYWLLDQQLSIAAADEAHWTTYLGIRRQFIERVRDMVEADGSLAADDKVRRTEALKGSLGRLALITPRLCVSYLRSWQADQQTWRRHIDALPAGLEPGEALGMLARPGCPPLNWRMRRRAERTARRYPAVQGAPVTGPRLRVPATPRADRRELVRVGAEASCSIGRTAP
jgi:hypothetical protein